MTLKQQIIEYLKVHDRVLNIIDIYSALDSPNGRVLNTEINNLIDEGIMQFDDCGYSLVETEKKEVGIYATLKERESRYGCFNEHARITQNIKQSMCDSPNWDGLDDAKKECLEMVAHKLGRILNGDPEYKDSYVDIAGYITLISDTLSDE